MMNQNLTNISPSSASLPLNDLELLHATYALSRIEQRATATLVVHLDEVDRRKAYALLSYPSLFEYVRNELGYSESSSYERISAMRLARQNEKAKQLIESGNLTLTGATLVQRFLKEEKSIGNDLSPSQQDDLLTAIAGKSKRETEKILLSKSSAPEQPRLKESTRPATPTHTEVKFFLDEEGMKILNRARDLVRVDSTAELFTEALKILIDKKERALGKTDSKISEPKADNKISDNLEAEPNHAASETSTQSSKTRLAGLSPRAELQTTPIRHRVRVPQPSTNSRFIPLLFKRQIHARSKGQCEYVSPITKTRCPSRAHLHVDHISPLAHGGRTELNNLRHLCQAHNQKAALQLGLAWQGIKAQSS